jgi:DNA invertase Pin-like site-specific DNA recombinase
MILVAYRHGLRASELTDLRWDQVDFATAFERGSPFTTAGFAPRNVDPFMLHIYAALAKKERSLISERTRAPHAGYIDAALPSRTKPSIVDFKLFWRAS